MQHVSRADPDLSIAHRPACQHGYIGQRVKWTGCFQKHALYFSRFANLFSTTSGHAVVFGDRSEGVIQFFHWDH